MKGPRGAAVLALALTLPLARCKSGETQRPEPPPAPAAPAPEPPEETVATVLLTVTSRSLHLREEPTARSASLGRLKKGDRVATLEERDGWVRVKLRDARTGWVDARYVRKGEPCLPDRPRPEVVAQPPLRMDPDGPRGRVVVEGEIDADGNVRKTRVVSNVSGSAELASRAEGELRQMKFLPPVRNCKATPFTYTYARNF